jgi:predicted DNA-binding protein
MDGMNPMDVTDDPGYTFSMKTAVSLPDEVFEGADRLARKMKKSRSQLYAEAISEYLALHDVDEVIAAIDRVCEATGDEYDPTVSAAVRRTLERVEW